MPTWSSVQRPFKFWPVSLFILRTVLWSWQYPLHMWSPPLLWCLAHCFLLNQWVWNLKARELISDVRMMLNQQCQKQFTKTRSLCWICSVFLIAKDGTQRVEVFRELLGGSLVTEASPGARPRGRPASWYARDWCRWASLKHDGKMVESTRNPTSYTSTSKKYRKY